MMWLFRLLIRRNTWQGSGVMVSPTSSPAEKSCAKFTTKTPHGICVPVDCGPAVEHASAYWRDLGRQVLQYQLRHVRSNARQYDAAARDKLQVAIARANVASQYNMNAGVQELESFSAASFTKDQFYL